MYNVLICDDEADIVKALGIYLKADDLRVFDAYNGQQALEIAKNNELHVILMDIMMPVMDGIEAMKKIREFSNVPIILLTAKSEDDDKIDGLQQGADDYITKPFTPGEVLARVRSALRRYTVLGGTTDSESLLKVGPIEMYDRLKKVYLDGEEIILTHTEYDILKLLMESPGRVFSTEEIYNYVWKDNPFGASNTVSVHVRHLREKIEINPAEPRYLKVVWGQGYRLDS